MIYEEIQFLAFKNLNFISFYNFQPPFFECFMLIIHFCITETDSPAKKSGGYKSNNMKKTLGLFLAVVAVSVGINAQNLVVTLTNASTETFAVEDIQSIKFGTETMILTELNGTVNTWDIDDIDNYAFDGVANISESTTITTDELNIYPNPSSNQVHVNYTSNRLGTITIAVYDLNGRKIEDLFSGEHQDTTAVTWNAQQNSSVQAGKYLIKIALANKVITKPVIIQ